MAGVKKTPAPAPQEGGVQIEAVEPIRHDGVDFAPGAHFTVTPEQAAALMAAGAVKSVG